MGGRAVAFVCIMCILALETLFIVSQLRL
jgi:hypothetical protein